jgi:DNA-binding NtrC family response regulator
MNESIALLISRCPVVIEQVKGVALGVPRVQIEVCSAQNASGRVQQSSVGLILAHLSADEEMGITRLLWSVAQARRPCPTVVLCDRFEEHQATAFLRAGAAAYVAIPTELNRLAFLMSVLTHRFRSATGPNGKAEHAAPDGLDSLMAEQVSRVAPQETTVLLTGETGTGKTRLARLIHELSPRKGEPFLVVDCGALSASLIESELFGHAKGAFTGADRDRAGKLAAAGSGTLLLDEINSLPLALQSKLLRAVDERVFEPVGSEKSQPLRARLIAASNVSLEEEVRAGRFRADLFYRLNVVGFFLPPLRGRRQSIAPLAVRFLREFASRNRPDVTGLSPAALTALERYHWPGNVRDLRNAVERGVALCLGPLVEPEDLPEAVRRAASPRAASPAVGSPPPVPRVADGEAPPTLAQNKEEVEVRRVLSALARHNDNRVHAAAELGISRIALYKKLHKYGLMRPRFQPHFKKTA